MGQDEVEMLMEIVSAKEKLEKKEMKIEAVKMIAEQFAKKVDKQLVQHMELKEDVERRERELELMKTLEELVRHFKEGAR